MMKLLRERHGYKCIVHIGDGATDMEASPPAVSMAITYALILSLLSL